MYTVQEAHEILSNFFPTHLQRELKVRAVESSSSAEMISRDLDKNIWSRF
jgi:hypothetical protein